MGTDNFHHKRKAKKIQDLARRKGRRAPYNKVLIVCEGEKTEPLYFQSLKDFYKLNTANVEICGDYGPDPKSILRFAQKRYREMREAGDPFNKVFCVFDKDIHTSYEQILGELRRATPKNIFVAITSVPCFEYWVLLHYEYTTRPYQSLPGISAANQVCSALKAHIPNYEKKNPPRFPQLLERLQAAKENAQKSLIAAQRSGTDNPSTRVHELVEYLQNLKNPP